jgi:hypothetical protein
MNEIAVTVERTHARSSPATGWRSSTSAGQPTPGHYYTDALDRLDLCR